MKNRFDNGDTVYVIMSRNDIFEFQGACEFKAVVRHVPADTGDMWYFEVPIGRGIVIAINPCSSDFIGLQLEPAPEPTDAEESI